MLQVRKLLLFFGAVFGALCMVSPAITDVSPVGVRFTSLDGGRDHACALDTLGRVWCWGRNNHGQLGDGTASARNVPTLVAGLGAGSTHVSAGWEHSCAIDPVGQAWCWGRNAFGALGDGTTSSSLTPVAVQGLGTGATSVEAGMYHGCGLDRRGQALCWGWNAWGILGDGTNSARATPAPVAVLGLRNQALAVAGNRSCALNRNGRAFCWGNYGGGQLGDGTLHERWTPVAVQGLTRAMAAITAGGDHTCAQDLRGRTFCWGSNWAGMLGDGTGTQRNSPVPVTVLGRGLVQVAAGEFFTCAPDAAGQAWCWGSNYHGALGGGTNSDRSAPVAVQMPVAP